MKLAILIPVYNAERFLRECLDSAIAEGQALQDEGAGTEVSVFCCDDGSNDGSLSILREYASHYGNVRYVSQPNAGVVSARNRLMDGLPADIDAFAFLDADDLIRPGMYRKLAEALERTNADVAETLWKGPETVLDDMSAFLLRRSAPGRWINVINKIYRRSAVGGIRFREGLRFEEDFFFNFEVHQAIRRKVLVPGNYYYYRPNPASATSVLNMRNYFDSASRRILLTCEEFLAAGRIPAAVEPAFRAELMKDAFRMCVRKNLRMNRDISLRRTLFGEARDLLVRLERDFGLNPGGLNPGQRLLYGLCLSGRYRAALFVSALT